MSDRKFFGNGISNKPSVPQPDHKPQEENMSENNKWIEGWGEGLTGPTTPSVMGPCCKKDWKFHVVSLGDETIAICPNQRDPISGKELPGTGKINAGVIANQAARIAQLEAEVAAKELTYTSEKPTTKGWYWFRGMIGDLTFDPQPVYFEEEEEPSVFQAGRWHFMSRIKGEFAGPIPQPKESSQSLEDRR
jgi:hypothetical protein